MNPLHTQISPSRTATSETMQGVVLRDCKLGDLKAVVAVERASFPGYPYHLSEFAFLRVSPRTMFTVATMDDEVVGYAIARREHRVGEIVSIAVIPEFRGKGIGKALMRAAMDYLEKCGRIYLMVERTNTNAINLYRSFSFQTSGRIVEGYYPDGGDAIEFEWKRADSKIG